MNILTIFLPHANEVWGKVIFSVACVKNSVGGGIPACIAAGIPAYLAVGGGWYPSMPCRFPGSHTGGKLRGLARGDLQGHNQEGSWGVWPGGSPGPHGGGSPGPHGGGLQAHMGGGLQAHTRGGYPACTEADPPPMAMHPTGMHSCSFLF